MNDEVDILLELSCSNIEVLESLLCRSIGSSSIEVTLLKDCEYFLARAIQLSAATSQP